MIRQSTHDKLMQEQAESYQRQLNEKNSEIGKAVMEALGLNRPKEWYGTQFETEYSNYVINNEGKLLNLSENGESNRVFLNNKQIGSVCGFKEELGNEFKIEYGLAGPATVGKREDILRFITPVRLGLRLYITAKSKCEPNSLEECVRANPFFISSPVQKISRYNPYS
jgi:hypothetical protein